MFKHNDTARVYSRAKSMEINIKFAKQIREENDIEKVRMIVNRLVDERYSKVSPLLLPSISEYSNSWTNIIKKFPQRIIKITRHPWFYNKYIYIISPFRPGLSNRHGNKIVYKYNLAPVKQRRVTAHEIILSHIFHIARRYYSFHIIDDWDVWKFSEIATVFLLNDKTLLKFWGNYIPPDNYFSKSIYPQLEELKNKLKKLYKRKHSFKDFIDQSVKVIIKE